MAAAFSSSLLRMGISITKLQENGCVCNPKLAASLSPKGLPNGDPSVSITKYSMKGHLFGERKITCTVLPAIIIQVNRVCIGYDLYGVAGY